MFYAKRYWYHKFNLNRLEADGGSLYSPVPIDAQEYPEPDGELIVL